MHNTNLTKRPPSYWIDQCIQLHNSPLRTGAHGPYFEKCEWYIMEIAEKELDDGRLGIRGILMKY